MLKNRGGKNKYITLNKLKYDENSQDVYLFVGLPIIGTHNNKKLNIVNNQNYRILKVTTDVIIIGDKVMEESYILAKKKAEQSKKSFIMPDDIIKIKTELFQRLFYPAYSFTIHKSQGQTIKEPYSIHEFYRLSHKLKFVALTRATQLCDINIIA